MKAYPTRNNEVPSPGAEEIERAGDAMLLIIPRAMWNTLMLQAQAEGSGPAQVLDKAFRAYLEANGSPEAIAYIHRISQGGSRG